MQARRRCLSLVQYPAQDTHLPRCSGVECAERVEERCMVVVMVAMVAVVAVVVAAVV